MSHLPPLTVFDVETTGLSPRQGHKIVEIAGVRIEDGNIMTETAYISLVNPEREIPWETKQIHKISDEDVVSARTIDEVLPEFLEFAKGSVLVAHNANFDIGFLTCEKELCWGYTDLPECICTMRLSQALYPNEFRHNLDAIQQRLQLPIPETRHRALPDVILTAQALLYMMEHSNIRSIDELKRLAGIATVAA